MGEGNSPARERLVIRDTGEAPGLDNDLAHGGYGCSELLRADIVLFLVTAQELCAFSVALGEELGGILGTDLLGDLIVTGSEVLEGSEG